MKPIPPRLPARRTGRRTLLAAAIGATLLVGGAPGLAHADPDDTDDIDELTERADELEDSYNGELLQFTEIKERVEEAEADLEETEEKLEASRGTVSAIAHARYVDGGVDPALRIVFDSSPQDMFSDAATAAYIGEQQAEQIVELVETRDEAEELAEELNTELEEATELVEELEEQKDEIEDRIAELEAQQEPETPGDGSVPDSARGPGWDGVTPTMATIRDDIVMQFGAPYPVGCYRPSADDHGEGRACDFMMSANGNWPSEDNRQLGSQIAEYATANADRLGIDYVIWEQQIWHTGNRQWRQMNDRGDLTQNHFDHVHVSSLA